MKPNVISLCQHQKLHKVVRVVYFSFSFFLSHLFNSFISGFWLRTTVAWCHIRRLEDKRWLGRELILGGLSGVLVRTPELNIYWWSLCDAGGVPHMLYVPRLELTLYVQQNQIRWMLVMVLDRCTVQDVFWLICSFQCLLISDISHHHNQTGLLGVWRISQKIYFLKSFWLFGSSP